MVGNPYVLCLGMFSKVRLGGVDISPAEVYKTNKSTRGEYIIEISPEKVRILYLEINLPAGAEKVVILGTLLQFRGSSTHETWCVAPGGPCKKEGVLYIVIA